MSHYNFSNNSHSQIATCIPISVQSTIYLFILVFACSGNSLVILSILRTKQKAMSSRIIMNLAICDLTLVISSIPAQITELHIGYFPFGNIGCHVVHPLSTMAVISGSLTLVFLAFERFVAICHPFIYFRVANRSRFLIFTHLIGLFCVIPYGITLETVLNHGKPECSESWSKASSSTYTIFLFVIQFGLPLPIICFLYFVTWRKLKATNDESVRRSRTTTRGIAYSKRDFMSEMNNNGHKKSARKRTSNRIYQEVFKSRNKQNVGMFRLFVTLVVVFATFMLPNQITWLYMAFSGKPIDNKVWVIIAYWLTYTNSVLNPLIYGTNKKFYRFFNKLLNRYKQVDLKNGQ